MRIKDLPAPVTAAKADWLPGTHWIGFTPTDASTNAREQRRATINAQMNSGYIIEYVTLKFDDPNPGFETDPRYLADKAAHGAVACKFIAVHRLRPSARSLKTILGDQEYDQLQICGPMATSAIAGPSLSRSSKAILLCRIATPMRCFRRMRWPTSSRTPQAR